MKSSNRSVRSIFLTAGILAALCLLLSSCGKKAEVPQAGSTAAESSVSESSVPETSAPETSAPETSAPESSAPGSVSAGGDGSHYLGDQDFLANVRYGLEQRWAAVADQDGEKLDTEDFRVYASAAINKELDAIDDLRYYSFQDEELGQIASIYCAALQAQLTGIEEAESQEALADNKIYMRGYCLRIAALHSLKEQYGLKVSEKYSSNLDDAVNRYDDVMKYLGIEE